MEYYMTGTGQGLNVHSENPGCVQNGCSVHAPSDHPMKEFPTHWRPDRTLMERICPHGVGHPDPDDLEFKRRLGLNPENWSIHGCDGCCSGKGQFVVLTPEED